MIEQDNEQNAISQNKKMIMKNPASLNQQLKALE